MKLYSIKQVSNILGVSRQRVDQLIQAGRLSFEWVGKIRIVYENELNRIKKQRSK